MKLTFDFHNFIHTISEIHTGVTWLRITENTIVFEDRSGKVRRLALKHISNFNCYNE